jgi:BirA family transcriptional regulator, biotin operon repressor / biotin---[acetyl-CoA-carboxylase] ligase
MSDWPQGCRREIHDRLDSTNAEALRRAAADAGPLWILARAQTAARGRRGRPWAKGEGDFAATLLMTPPGGPATAALRSFAAALALREALAELTGRPERFSLKWPNDVLLSGAKLAGILLETAGPPLRLAIGFGVNLARAPDPRQLEETAMPPISLAAATGRTHAPEALLDRLAPAFARWEARLATEGFAPVRAEWLAHAAGLGGPVTARMPGRTLAGRFETIDATGALVLATASGPVAVPAAEIHFGDPADPPAPPPDGPPGAPPTPGDPDLPPGPGSPEGPDLPPEEPPVQDPPAPDTPPENPPVYDPPAPDVPGEIPPQPPTELPPSGPPEIPQQVSHAARH